MARKWSNLNLPGALHYIAGNFLDRTPVFTDPACCKVFLDELEKTQPLPLPVLYSVVAHQALVQFHYHFIEKLQCEAHIFDREAFVVAMSAI